MPFEAPEANFKRGIRQVDIPELGEVYRGKVRDNWNVEVGNAEKLRVMVTTDRLSAFDSVICTVPLKGQSMNGPSLFWFDVTKGLIPNHVVDSPHANVVIAREAQQTLPVEMVVRGYLARSGTHTSIFYNYFEKGRRTIYGIEFPDGLIANQRFPDGPIVTPTTKAIQGEHDEELTTVEAEELVDSVLGKGVYEQAEMAALRLFHKGMSYARSKGLILADTKYEMGLDNDGRLMLIDEIHTPDSSRWWLSQGFDQAVAEGRDPLSFDKEYVRKWLKDNGFTGQPGETIPVIPDEVLDVASNKYLQIGNLLSAEPIPNYQSTAEEIRQAVLQYLDRH